MTANDGKRKKFNVCAKAREVCEKKLAKLIAKKKEEIVELKKVQKIVDKNKK